MTEKAPGHDPRRTRWEWITLATMYAGYAALMLCRNTLIASSAAVVQDPAAGIDKAAYGRIMSWHSAGAIAGKLTLGVLADRIGGRWMYLVCLLFTALTTIAFRARTGSRVAADASKLVTIRTKRKRIQVTVKL